MSFIVPGEVLRNPTSPLSSHFNSHKLFFTRIAYPLLTRMQRESRMEVSAVASLLLPGFAPTMQSTRRT